MKGSDMTVFSSPAFDDHEQVIFCTDKEAGLRAIIAIHDTGRGPALGGLRMWPYESETAAIDDVLKLARGMTYKNALADLPYGGGKTVIIGDSRTDKNEDLLRAMARFVDRLGGRYLTAEDVGINVDDIDIMRRETAFVVGSHEDIGNPSPITAHGVYSGIRAAVKFKLGRDDLAGLRFAVQGVGNVGYELCKRLAADGARLWVTDIDAEAVRRAGAEFSATMVAPDEIYGLEVDVFAPCALGGTVNAGTIARLRCAIVAGCANNQLAEARDGETLRGRGILYAPDYVINAGGVIGLFVGESEDNRQTTFKEVERIHATLTEIFKRAETAGTATNIAADRLAEERFKRHRVASAA